MFPNKYYMQLFRLQFKCYQWLTIRIILKDWIEHSDQLELNDIQIAVENWLLTEKYEIVEESSGKAVLLKILRSFRNCSAPTQRWEEVSEETVAQGLAHNQRPFKNLKATEHELEFGSVFFIYIQVDWFLRPLGNSLRKRWISRSDGWRQLSRVKTNSSSWFLLVSFLFWLSDVQKVEQLSSFV